MTASSAAWRQLALTAIAQRGGTATDTAALAAAAQRTYDDLERASAPLIGQVGMDALTGRALYLAQQNLPWMVDTGETHEWDGPFAQIASCLGRQEPAVAVETAGAVFVTLAGLLANFIGEPLTVSLLKTAWPDAFTDANAEET